MPTWLEPRARMRKLGRVAGSSATCSSSTGLLASVAAAEAGLLGAFARGSPASALLPSLTSPGSAASTTVTVSRRSWVSRRSRAAGRHLWMRKPARVPASAQCYSELVRACTHTHTHTRTHTHTHTHTHSLSLCLCLSLSLSAHPPAHLLNVQQAHKIEASRACSRHRASPSAAKKVHRASQRGAPIPVKASSSTSRAVSVWDHIFSLLFAPLVPRLTFPSAAHHQWGEA